MRRNITLHRVYPHPIALVWQAITDPKIMRRWMQMDTDFVPEVGHRFELRDISGNWNGVLYCEILAVEPPEHLAYRFKGGAMRHDTTVSIRLAETPDGTRLTLEHTGFTGLTDIAISGIIGLGWRRMLKHLTTTLKVIDNPPGGDTYVEPH